MNNEWKVIFTNYQTVRQACKLPHISEIRMKNSIKETNEGYEIIVSKKEKELFQDEFSNITTQKL